MKKSCNLNQNELKQLNKDALCKVILEMQELIQEKDKQNDVLVQENDVLAQENDILTQENDILTQELNLLRHKKFGRKSEKITDEETDCVQLTFEGIFNEVEAVDDAEPSDKEETITVPEHKRRVRRKGKQEEDLSKLRKVTEHFRMDEDKLSELFPNGYRELPEDIVTQLEHVPAQFYVKENHVHVYCDKTDNSRIIRADAPPKLFGKGLASPSVVAGIANGKYVNALPLYRIEQEFQRNDVPVTRQTMANWMVMSAERYFSLFFDRLKSELFTHNVIHCDETPMIVTKDNRKAGAKSYMWVYRSNALDSNPVVLFDYRKTRAHTNPKEFLSEFTGTLVTDGFSAYHTLARLRSGEIKVGGCWVHTLRKYKDALKGMGKSGKGTAAESVAEEAVKKIGEIFDLDNKLDKMTSEERLKHRQEKIKPKVDEFFAWIKEHRHDVTLKSLTGKAITYSINQEKYLRLFLDDGEVPMENNAAERAIRPFCIGKKNWIMSDTIHGAESSGIIYSITETAKANNLKPYNYLKYLLEEIPKHMDDIGLEFLDDLLPWSEKLPDECRKVQLSNQENK